MTIIMLKSVARNSPSGTSSIFPYSFLLSRPSLLDLEHPLHEIRLLARLSPTRPSLCDIFGIVFSNDILPSLGVVHLGLKMGEEAVEEPVENGRGDEGVDVADSESDGGG